MTGAGRSGYDANAEARLLTLRKKKSLFLDDYRLTGIISAACDAADIARTTYYDWLERDPAFAADVEIARVESIEHHEREVYRRGVEGIDKPLSWQGHLTGDVVREYSDSLLMFRTKKLDPSYRDATDVTLHGGLNVLSVAVDATGQLTDAQRAAIRLALVSGAAVAAPASSAVSDTDEES